MTAFGQNEKRLALVVGNAEYLGKGNSLRNPVNDANDVSAKLKTLGFDVTKLTNGSLMQLDDAIDAFGKKAKNADVALFYYSGHGLQSKGDNYLVPVDADLRSEADVRYKCTAVNHLIAKLDESGCHMKVIVLDACRNNPFERSWSRGLADKGLSFVNAPKGTLISYATSPGMTADDGNGRNSPYTEAFLKTLDEPGLTLLNFFNEVGTKVQTQTHEEQIPWVTSSALTGSFCFNTTAVPTAAPAVTQKPNPTLEQALTPPAPSQTTTSTSSAPPTNTPSSSLTITANGHEWVDLGLPSGTLWATCNVGASKPEDYGNYYAWGETGTKSTYDWDNYKYDKRTSFFHPKLTKYCTKSAEGDDGFSDNLTELQSSDDPATANWGSGWRTPTKAQWDELLANTTNQWTTQNGVKGRKFTSKKNGQTLFLPAAGLRQGSRLNHTDSYGNYWTSSLWVSNEVLYLSFDSHGCNANYLGSRYDGFTVRPVRQN